MLLNPEINEVVGAFVVQTSGATRTLHNWSGTYRPAGVGEHVQTGIGVPQELGRSCRFHGRIPGRGYRVTNPRPDAAARSGGGSETCVIPWYRQVKETKRGGRDDRKSQCLDSTGEAGKQTPVRTPGREARHREHGLVVGTYDGYLEIRCTYYRNSNG